MDMNDINVKFTRLLLFLSVAFVALTPLSSYADFGEIDLLVRESIESHFREHRQAVDLEKLSYLGEPKLVGATLSIQSSVWAEQRLIKPYWGWYECTTKIEVKAPRQYVDQGTECFFDFD
jgi:hypothetical protein